MIELQYHPAADAFPLMDKDRYAELLTSIRTKGQVEPITICEGMILDGRNRYRACLELGIEPKTRTFDGDPWSHAWILNGERRDLTADQRYLIWLFCNEHSEAFQAEKQRIADEANRKRAEATREQHEVSKPYAGEKKPEMVLTQPVLAPADPNIGQTSKAEASHTNRGAVARGDSLKKNRPDLADKVMKGEMKPAEAHRQMKKDEVKGKAASLPKGQYAIIYADPPWEYSDKQSGSISESYGGAEKHYPSMTMTELKALDIQSMSAENCVLFLWATCPLLENALELVRAWGFRYKAQFVWDKVKHNMGHYNSVRHELLLICTKGSATPQNVKLHDSVQVYEKTNKHSEKPEQFRSIIDELYPVGPRIELFRRGSLPDGWETWGNEAL